MAKKMDLKHINDAMSAVEKVIKKIEDEKLKLPNPMALKSLKNVLKELQELKEKVKKSEKSEFNKFEKNKW